MSRLPYRNPPRSGHSSEDDDAGCGAGRGRGELRHAAPATLRQDADCPGRANWLHEGACTVLKRIGMEVVADGDPPLHGLVVSNHLSYLDVLAYASVSPCLSSPSRRCGRGLSWDICHHGRHNLCGPRAGRGERRRGCVDGRGAGGRCAGGALSRGYVERRPIRASLHSSFFEPAVGADAMVTAAAIGYASSTAEERRPPITARTSSGRT